MGKKHAEVKIPVPEEGDYEQGAAAYGIPVWSEFVSPLCEAHHLMYTSQPILLIETNDISILKMRKLSERD